MILIGQNSLVIVKFDLFGCWLPIYLFWLFEKFIYDLLRLPDIVLFNRLVFLFFLFFISINKNIISILFYWFPLIYILYQIYHFNVLGVPPFLIRFALGMNSMCIPIFSEILTRVFFQCYMILIKESIKWYMILWKLL